LCGAKPALSTCHPKRADAQTGALVVAIPLKDFNLG
jgi:hypothetical protein